jgi:hypothetical protein
MLQRANPDRETADWRAVCGRTACTVRRAGRTWVFPDPYQQLHIESGLYNTPAQYVNFHCLLSEHISVSYNYSWLI